MTKGIVQWFKVARDEGGGFRFVPASWSDLDVPVRMIVAEARSTAPAAGEETAEPVCAAPATRPL